MPKNGFFSRRTSVFMWDWMKDVYKRQAVRRACPVDVSFLWRITAVPSGVACSY